jgi:hypothetical protein
MEIVPPEEVFRNVRDKGFGGVGARGRPGLPPFLFREKFFLPGSLPGYDKKIPAHLPGMFF